jgi:hypothetical protein
MIGLGGSISPNNNYLLFMQLEAAEKQKSFATFQLAPIYMCQTQEGATPNHKQHILEPPKRLPCLARSQDPLVKIKSFLLAEKEIHTVLSILKI